jgi:hypothetical protein
VTSRDDEPGEQRLLAGVSGLVFMPVLILEPFFVDMAVSVDVVAVAVLVLVLNVIVVVFGVRVLVHGSVVMCVLVTVRMVMLVRLVRRGVISVS